jgi:hypothetical protein
LENEVANQGFERFRESIQQVNTTEKDALAEYCAKSLYSYSFTPVSRINRAAKAKKNALNREMDHMQRIRWRAGESESSRRFSQPNIGALNKSEWRNNWGSSELVKSPSMQNGPVKLLEDEEEVCYPTSSTPTSPNKDETFWSDPSQIVDLDPYHNRGRRQTIQIDPTDNNMPPIYEVTPEPNIPPACVAQYNRALHAPSRYLPQNQVILTTDVEGTVLLFNDMASLCFGIDKSYVGKSILDVLEEPFRAKITNLLARRKNPASNPHLQLLKGEKLKKGHVLMYGVVVSKIRET